MHYLYRLLLFSLLLLVSLSGVAQNFEYSLDWNREGALLAGGAFLSAGSHMLESGIDGLSRDELAAMPERSVWFLDRGATRQKSEAYRGLSDDLLRAAVLVPGTLMIGRRPRRRALVLATMLAETMLLNDGITKTTKVLFLRSRPLVYNPEHNPVVQTSNDVRQSFVSGHTSNTAALSFFTAKVFHDLYPDSPLRPLVWAGAAALPLLTGHARYQAGKHFPTDIAAGYLLGATLGVLIPELHRRPVGSSALSFDLTENGMGLVYRW